MAEVTVVARIKARPDAAAKVRAEALKLIAPTRNDDEGCIKYELYQDNSDPSLLYFLERWKSDALLDKHLDTPHLRAFVQAVEESVLEMDVNRLSSLG